MDTSKVGYVYVLQMEGFPYFKIGRTVCLSRRLGEISPQMPGRLIVAMAHQVIDAWRIESALHSDFRQRRLNGEWFYLEAIDLFEIQSVLLADQSVRLYQSLLSAGNSYSDPVRHARALYHAAIRMRRRQERYFAYSYDREVRMADQSGPVNDPVLEAEIVI